MLQHPGQPDNVHERLRESSRLLGSSHTRTPARWVSPHLTRPSVSSDPTLDYEYEHAHEPDRRVRRLRGRAYVCAPAIIEAGPLMRPSPADEGERMLTAADASHTCLRRLRHGS